MSTRCQILVKGTGVYIYKHCDGYPDSRYGVLHVLAPFVRYFLVHRGWDPEYLVAQILREFAVADWRDRVARSVESKRERQRGGSAESFARDARMHAGMRQCERTTGWGVSKRLHGDEEYIYIVSRQGIEIRVPEKGYWEDPALSRTTLEREIRFDGKGGA